METLTSSLRLALDAIRGVILCINSYGFIMTVLLVMGRFS